ncbi:Polysaccharide deacetylase [Persephonella hydrogeniphila]|uniref:Polysaccharide deacetylase n=1 Tax=Persephonella hydrogeniphila TaxID=198703 RepID=A0A285NRB0_9AQUI|nr:polysaccharide deacetylase family protein [Persephonella hydrogeniphila]SNZ10396.1 Polysaccharide deacetylase [Persephonella hydrogeniphila]
MKNNIFVIFYHKIIPRWGHSKAVSTFYFEMKILKKYFNVITLDDVYEYLTTDRQPDRPSVVISFDDGYLDNYVYAYPVLKKLGLKATIFPISSRILKKDIKRPTLEDYWNGKVSKSELHRPKTMAEANYEFLSKGESEDFLSVSELNSMKDVFDIQGHAKIHAKVFYSEEIIDFYDGKNGHWSNIYAYGNSNDFSSLEKPVLGYPLFPDRNNLSVRRGFLKKEVKDYIKSLDKSFFKKRNWKDILKKELEKNFSSFLNFETEEERKKRVENELIEAKKELESIIGQKVRYLSYPFGHYDDELVEISSHIYDASYTIEKDIIRKGQNLHKLPRIEIAKDFPAFISKIVKFSVR